MTCKNCIENVVPNKVTKSLAPFVYYPWKHEHTHLIGCYQKDGTEVRGAKAWPREGQ